MITVLSLFDGLGGARVSLDRLGIPCRYYASEVDKYAIKIAMKNYPDIIQVGDINNLDFTQFKNIDLIIGGSPCQDLSIAKKNRKGLKGERSGLFWKFVEAIKIIKPKYFLLENVNSMNKESKKIITQTLGVEPIMINSALLTAQIRKRLFWCNWKVIQPRDKHIYLKDILEKNVGNKYFVSNKHLNAFIRMKKKYNNYFRCRDINGKTTALTATYYKQPVDGNYIYSIYNRNTNKNKSYTLTSNSQCITAKGGQILITKSFVRRLTEIECERLQGLPNNYTKGVSNTQRYKMIGNGFTIPVIVHILKGIK